MCDICLTHLGQISELVGIQQQFLQASAVSVNLIGNIQQRAVASVDRLDVTVAPPQWDTVKHPGLVNPCAAVETRVQTERLQFV